MKNFPKVLIISIDPFNKSDGTGITLSNLFDGWDKNSIAQVYISDKVPSSDVCNLFYQLDSKVAIFDYYLRRLLSFFYKAKSEMNASPAAVRQNSSSRGLRNIIHLNLRAIADFSPLFLPRRLIRWISEFDPDIIYCALGSCQMISLTNAISTKVGKPIVPHFMDDWPSTLYTQNELGGLARQIFNRRFNSMLLKSNGGLCISQQMAEEYVRRYQLPFSPFVNCVEDSLFCLPEKVMKNDEFILMYIGGLHLNRWKSILDISEAISMLNNGDKKIILKIYCPSNDIKLYAPYFINLPSTRFEGSLTSNEVPQALRAATLLIHVESFEQNYLEYTKFSLSTKIPQYMAAGKAILGYAPKILASMQHIQKANAGKVISHKGDISDVLCEIIGNKELLSQYAINGFNYAMKNHSKSNNIKQLKSVLISYCKVS